MAVVFEQHVCKNSSMSLFNFQIVIFYVYKDITQRFAASNLHNLMKHYISIHNPLTHRIMRNFLTAAVHV